MYAERFGDIILRERDINHKIMGFITMAGMKRRNWNGAMKQLGFQDSFGEELSACMQLQF